MSLQPQPRSELMKMLDENHYLIHHITDLQNKGRVADCHVVQKHLLKNLLYLGTLANEQIKKEEMQLSPSTRSRWRTQSKISHVATLPITSLDADKCLKPNEALPTAAQHKASVVTSTPPQETPVIVNMARPRRLQSTFVEGNSMSAPYRPLVRVQVPMSATVTAESISAIPQVTGTAIPLQRPIAVTMPQTTQLQTIQSHRCSHEVPQSGSITSPGGTIRIQAIPASSNNIIVAPAGQVLQNPMSASGSTRLSSSIIIPVASSGIPQEPAHADASASVSVQSSSAVPVQQFIATMTSQGMVLVPMTPAP